MDEYINEQECDAEQDEREELPVPAALQQRMFPHQKEGEYDSKGGDDRRI